MLFCSFAENSVVVKQFPTGYCPAPSRKALRLCSLWAWLRVFAGTSAACGYSGSGNIRKPVVLLWIVVLVLGLHSSIAAQDFASSFEQQSSSVVSGGLGYVFNYLNMAGTEKASDFRPLTQEKRTQLYLETMANPLGYIKGGFSAGIDQWRNKPPEWQQGMSGYGKRYVNIMSQYSIQRTVTFGLSSSLHEDNRYFNSGRKGFWTRTGYALTSGLVARNDSGNRHLSISQLGGVAAGAFLSRAWQPHSQNSATDGAVSFSITMLSNMGFGVVKEFLPDIGRSLNRRRKKP
jgi:hypothetical protein